MKVKLGWVYNEKESNLVSLYNFIAFVKSEEFNEKVRIKYTREANRKKLLDITRAIVLTEIYAIGDDKGRTHRAYWSFKASPVLTKGNDCGQITVFSDPHIAENKVGNERYSYVGFFENPNMGRKGSFIKPRGQLTPSRYRPFLGVMTDALKTKAAEMANDAAKNVMKRRLPNKR